MGREGETRCLLCGDLRQKRQNAEYRKRIFCIRRRVGSVRYSLFKGAERAVIITAEGKQMPVSTILGANDMYDVIKFRVAITEKKVPALIVANTAPAVEPTRGCFLILHRKALLVYRVK